MSKINMPEQIVMKKISDIKPYIRNPRKNDKTVNLLVEVIPKVGFNVPILIDEKGVIVKGHARYTAAIRLGMSEVPCVVTHADEEAIRLDRISDNKISEFSEWDVEELMHELDAISIDDINLGDFGFPVDDLEQLVTDFGFDDEDDSDDKESEEEKMARYEEYLAKHKTPARPTVEVTEAHIEKATEAQYNIAEKPKKYFKVICPDCGKLMFIAENEAVFELRVGEQ